jgi:hypothetical protein
VLKPENHSHHQVERCEVLPQRIASWVDDGMEPLCTTCDAWIYCARDHALEGESPIPLESLKRRSRRLPCKLSPRENGDVVGDFVGLYSLLEFMSIYMF